MFFTDAPTPPSTSDPTNFNARADAFLAWMATFPDEAEAYGAFLAAANLFGIVIPYIFSTTTTDSDPGAGVLRLNNATQNAATVIRADLVDSQGGAAAALLDMLDDSTSTQKGVVRLMKAGDSRVWIYAYVTAVATPSGYRNVTISQIDASSANPFANGDAVILAFVPKGDKGDPSSWQNDGSLVTISTTPTTITLGAIPSGFSNLKVDARFSPASSAGLQVALSTDGASFGSPIVVSTSATSFWGALVIRDYRSDMPLLRCDSSVPAPSAGAAGGPSSTLEYLVNLAGGIAALRLSLTGGVAFSNGGTIQRRVS